MGVLELVGLLEHGVLECVALAQRPVAVVVVVHPLIDRSGLLAHRLQRGVRMQQRQRGGQTVVRHARHADVAVVRHMLDEPVDAVVRVSGLIGGGRIFEIDLGRQFEDSLRFEAAAQVLDHEDVAVLRQLLDAGRHLPGRLIGHAVRRAAKQDRQGSCPIDRRQDHRLQAYAVADRDHDFFELEQRLRRRLLRVQIDGKEQNGNNPETPGHRSS